MAEISAAGIRQSIQDILKNADLSSLSSKKVRKSLEEKYGIELTERKKEIDTILMEVIKEFENQKEKKPKSNSTLTDSDSGSDSNEDSEDEADVSQRATHNDINQGSDSNEDSEDEADKEPPKKKLKTSTAKPTKKPKPHKEQKSNKLKTPSHIDHSEDSNNDELNDEELAKKLQAQEGRTRHHRTVKRQPVRKKSGADKKPRKKSGTSGYSQPCVLSPDLTEIVGRDRMARSDVVKRMWQIVRERKLEDPKNKQFMFCDEQLMKVFGKKRVRTFGMMKYLKNHIKDAKDIVITD